MTYVHIKDGSTPPIGQMELHGSRRSGEGRSPENSLAYCAHSGGSRNYNESRINHDLSCVFRGQAKPLANAAVRALAALTVWSGIGCEYILWVAGSGVHSTKTHQPVRCGNTACSY